jgi:hypothetical protein
MWNELCIALQCNKPRSELHMSVAFMRRPRSNSSSYSWIVSYPPVFNLEKLDRQRFELPPDEGRGVVARAEIRGYSLRLGGGEMRQRWRVP